MNTETGAWLCHGCGSAGGPYRAALARGLNQAEANTLLARHGFQAHSGAGSPIATSEQDVAAFQEALLTDAALLQRLHEQRLWLAEALARLGVGYDGERIVFPLRDEHGLLVGVGRYAPGPDREGPKMLADSGSKRELFPAPEVVTEGEGFLYLVEGEPDAVAAHSLGLAAVAIGGAASWQADQRKRFTGRRVAIVFDADEPGRNAAERIAADLAPVAAEVRVVELAPRTQNDGFDLTDYLLTLRGQHLTEKQQQGLLERRASRGRLVEPDRGSQVLEAIVRLLRRYVVLSDAQLDAIALWVAHTHAFEAAEATPYLAITSAEKESGKTRLLETLEQVVAKPWLTGRATPAVLTRKIDAEAPTLLLDESDAAFGGEKEYAEVLRGILNTGYRRGGKTSVAVPTGREFTYRDLSTFSPKAIAGIGKLPDTVQSRSIPIRLKRKGPDERVERFRRRDVEAQAAAVRERVERFAAVNLEALEQARPELPEELGDRAADVWEPLLAIADLADGSWPARARAAALALSAKQEGDDDSLGVRLLADIRTVFLKLDRERIFTTDLIDELGQIEDAPWGDWYGKPISTRKLAALLKPHGIKPKTIRIGEETRSGYDRGWFADAWTRYLPPPSEPAPTKDDSGDRLGRPVDASLAELPF